jgi:hypothetical protein
LAHAQRELAGAFVRHLVQDDEVDQLVDAPLRNSVGLSEREQVVVGGERPVWTERASSSAPTS